VRTNRPAPPRASSATRQAAERRSAVPLVYLRHLPTWVPPVVLAVLLVTGLAVRGWGGTVALCLVAAFLAWLAYLSWPMLGARGRLGRAAAVICLLALAAWQATR
jgi:hypothetical protein